MSPLVSHIKIVICYTFKLITLLVPGSKKVSLEQIRLGTLDISICILNVPEAKGSLHHT